MLELDHICAGYPGNIVLHDVSLQAKAGQVTVILGPNGCGKSTLLKSVCGIVPVKNGQVLLHGQPLLELSRAALAQTVSYLAQGRQVPQITAGRLVLHGRFPYLGYPRRYRQEDYAAAAAAMAQLGIAELADVPMEKLSGGQRQKVYIAMALAQDTPVVLLDEPMAYLDVTHQLQLMALARQLGDMGKTVVMVLHDLSLALQQADHMIVMEQGCIAAAGTPEEIYASAVLERIFHLRLGCTDGHYYYDPV